MAIRVRPIQTEEEYHAVEDLQREIWGAHDVEIVAFETLMTAHKNGGVMLGAFDSGASPPALVGFVFGFVGLTPDGRLKHCSHIAGVLPDYRDQQIGYLLKLCQREQVLEQGIGLITWTFDPLESRNGRFNFHKLGCVCNTYLRNHYGAMRDVLNAGLPSDRFQVDWHIAGERVDRWLDGEIENPPVPELLAAGVALANQPIEGDLLRPPEKPLPLAGERVLVQIPADFQRLKSADRDLALAWRLHTRELFEAAFAGGYLVTDLLLDDGRSFYLLERENGEDR
jgi:predicted GNAT superfamily acetyltransferase